MRLICCFFFLSSSVFSLCKRRASWIIIILRRAYVQLAFVWRAVTARLAPENCWLRPARGRVRRGLCKICAVAFSVPPETRAYYEMELEVFDFSVYYLKAVASLPCLYSLFLVLEWLVLTEAVEYPTVTACLIGMSIWNKKKQYDYILKKLYIIYAILISN